MLFDLEGSGGESLGRAQLQARVEQRMRASWGPRAAVIVIEPELENWVWARSRRVAESLGWRRTDVSVRAWLEASGDWLPDVDKPTRPKEAMLKVLRETRTPRSPSRFLELASVVELSGCVDLAFDELKSVLRDWFAEESADR